MTEHKERTPEWVAEVFPDWTTLQIIESGMAFAFNRATGRVYKLPSDECPFVQLKPLSVPIAARDAKVEVTDAMVRRAMRANFCESNVGDSLLFGTDFGEEVMRAALEAALAKENGK